MGTMRDHAALSASADHPAFNTPECARPPAALSTSDLEQMARSLDLRMAWKDGLRGFCRYKRGVWYENSTPRPRPPEEPLGDPALIGAWRHAAAFGDNVWDRYPRLDEDANVRTGLLSTPCGRVPTQFAVLTPTPPIGAALITAGATPTSFTTPTPFPTSSKDSDFRALLQREADVRDCRESSLASSTQSAPTGAAPIAATAASTPICSPPPESRSSSPNVFGFRARLSMLAATCIAALACGWAARIAVARAPVPSDAAPLAHRHSTRLRRSLVSLSAPLPSRGK